MRNVEEVVALCLKNVLTSLPDKVIVLDKKESTALYANYNMINFLNVRSDTGSAHQG